MATTATPTFAGVYSTNFECIGSTLYTTGTASQSGNTVTGAGGASWSAVPIGSVIRWGSGSTGFVVNVVSSTSLTVIPSQVCPLFSFAGES